MKPFAGLLLLAGVVAALALTARSDGQLPAKVKPDTKALVDDNKPSPSTCTPSSHGNGNLFFSPYSISTALAMTYGGARGETAEEMAAALHFALPPERLHAAFADLIRHLNNGGKARRQAEIANRLWGQKDYGFLPAFLKLTRTTTAPA